MFEEVKGSLKVALNKLQIKEGDILYISSDIKTLLFNLVEKYNIKTQNERNKVLNSFIDELQNIVGKEGTLLFPVFSWAWCKEKIFDIKNTKGEVGSLSNWILFNRKDFIRTRHPIYSFMVWGGGSEHLKNMDNQDAWSHSSPFYYLQTHNAKQLLFNIEAYQGLTFSHYVEQEVKVPYRHPKYFFGKYIDENGNSEYRMYSMYVRDTDEFKVKCNIHNNWLIENKVALRVKWENNLLTVVDLQKSYFIIRKDILENNGENTLLFENYNLDWNKKSTVPFEINFK